VFAGGGLVIEAGHASDAAPGAGVAPLIARVAMPHAWRCVVAVPERPPAMSGAAEDEALRALPTPSDTDVERVAHLVHDVLAPAAASADLPTFGKALTEIQRINGQWFAPAQGGTFAPGPSEHLVQVMAKWGAPGVGQSSWGPAVYAIVEGVDASVALAAHISAELGSSGAVYEGPFRGSGARVWRSADDETGEVDR
jgi:beta-ribofuranosylaminobenzene 5'-phosphate synthase